MTEAQALGGNEGLAQTDPADPASQVVSKRVERQPHRVGRELARRQVVQADAVLEVANGVLNLGVTAVVGLDFEHGFIAVGDEGVVAEGHSEKVQLSARVGPYAAHNQAHRLTLAVPVSKRGVGRLSNLSTVQEVRDWHPIRIWNSLNRRVQRL